MGSVVFIVSVVLNSNSPNEWDPRQKLLKNKNLLVEDKKK